MPPTVAARRCGRKRPTTSGGAASGATTSTGRTPAPRPTGLIGSVPEDPTGATATYTFTDTGAAAVGWRDHRQQRYRGRHRRGRHRPPPATLRPPPTRASNVPGTGGAGLAAGDEHLADSSISQEIGLDQAFAAANGLTNYNPAIADHRRALGPREPESASGLPRHRRSPSPPTDTSRQPTQYSLPYPNGTGTALTAPRYPSNIYYNASNWPDEINEYNTLYVAPSVSIGTYSGPESPTPVPENGRCDDTAVTTCLTTPATEPTSWRRRPRSCSPTC